MKKVLLIIVWLVGTTVTIAQNSVGIGTSTPNNNAVLELVSTNSDQGFLVPRLNSTQITAMEVGLAPADQGMLVFNVTIQSFLYWNGSAWTLLGGTDADWVINNDTVYNDSHYVVVGQTSPLDDIRMLVVNDGLRSALAGSSDGDGSGAIGVQGYASGSSDINIGVFGLSESNSALDTVVGVYGNATDAQNFGIGVIGEAETGVAGASVRGGNFQAMDLIGNGNLVGVEGSAQSIGVSAASAIGVYGTASGAVLNYAGFFEDGDVYVKNKLGLGVLNPITPLQIGAIFHVDTIFEYVLLGNNLVYDTSIADFVRTEDGTGQMLFMGDEEFQVQLYGNGTAGSATNFDDTASFRLDWDGAGLNFRNPLSSDYGLRVSSANGLGLLLQTNNRIRSLLTLEDTLNFQLNLSAPELLSGGGYTFTLPVDGGTNGQVLATDGTGNTSWQASAGSAAWNITGNSGTSTTNFIGTSDAQNLSFRTNSIERMSITSGGNVGIGVTNPNNPFEIAGSAIFRSSGGISRPSVDHFSIAVAASTVFLESNNAGTPISTDFEGKDYSFNTGNGTISTNPTRLYIGDNGNVGIGTTGTNELLTVDGVLSLREQAANPTSSVNYGKIYPKTDNNLYYLAADGTEHNLSGSLINLYGNNGVLTGSRTVTQNSNDLTFTSSLSSGNGVTIENNVSGISGSALSVSSQGTRSISNTAMTIDNLVTKVGGSNSTKVGLTINSTGSWAPGTFNQPNVGLQVNVSGADDNYAAIFNGGDVGIGTFSPNKLGNFRALTISASETYSGEKPVGLELQGSTASGNGLLGQISFIHGSGSTEATRIESRSGSGNVTYGQLVFYTRNANGLIENMRINENGNIGIGTPTTTYKLNVLSDDLTQRGIFVDQNKSDGTSYGSYIDVDNNNTGTALAYGTYATVTNNGGTGQVRAVWGNAGGNSTGVKYGVYGSASGSGTLYGVYCSGNGGYTGTWMNVSDIKFKENIKTYTEALPNLMKLVTKEYTYKTTGEYSHMNMAEGVQIGFIAQEVAEIFPTLVEDGAHPGKINEETGEEETEIKYKGMNYIGLVPITVKAIQEQQTQIEELKAENATLKTKYESQQLQIDNLIKMIQEK